MMIQIPGASPLGLVVGFADTRRIAVLTAIGSARFPVGSRIVKSA